MASGCPCDGRERGCPCADTDAGATQVLEPRSDATSHPDVRALVLQKKISVSRLCRAYGCNNKALEPLLTSKKKSDASSQDAHNIILYSNHTNPPRLHAFLIWKLIIPN